MKVLDAEKPWAEPFDPRLFHVKTGNSVNVARRGESAPHSRSSGFYSAIRLVAALRPVVMTSEIALPPRRLLPWKPPVTSPAA